MDLILANRRAKHGVKDVQATINFYFPSDHFPIETKFKIKLKKHNNNEKDDSGEWKGAEKPDENSRKKFEEDFVTYYNELLEERSSKEQTETTDKFAKRSNVWKKP